MKIYFYNFKKILFIMFCTISFISFKDIAFSAADIPGSSDNDIKIFNNWRVYKLKLKNGNNFVALENLRNGDQLFRIIFDKNNNTAYFDLYPNYKNYPDNIKQNGNIILSIGNNSYNVPAEIEVKNNFVITSLMDMPDNFIDMAKKNKYFLLSYHPAMPPGTPIDLNGFSNAIDYVNKINR